MNQRQLNAYRLLRMAAKLEQQGDTRLAKKLASQGLGVKLNQIAEIRDQDRKG